MNCNPNSLADAGRKAIKETETPQKLRLSNLMLDHLIDKQIEWVANRMDSAPANYGWACGDDFVCSKIYGRGFLESYITEDGAYHHKLSTVE